MAVRLIAPALPADAVLTRSPNEDAGLCIAQRYELQARIGHGASGTVYRALDLALNRPVALKLLDPGVLSNAEHEAKLLAGVAHPNVVAVHDFGCSEGRRFLVLELLEGESLSSWLQREARTPEQIVSRFLAAARGLHAAHEAGVAHGDFKPDNVIVNERGRVVVLDFGCARELGGASNARSLARGTLGYMAPERLEDHPRPSPQADQFALCVSLWRALVGTAPFPGTNLSTRIEAMRRGPTAATPTLSRRCRRVLVRGMAFDPAHRFPSMRELVAELEQLSPVRAGMRPLFVALIAAATFALGWGLAHYLGPGEPSADTEMQPLQ